LEDNNKTNFKGLECEDVDWVHVSQDRIYGGLLWTRQWTFGFQKRLGNSSAAE